MNDLELSLTYRPTGADMDYVGSLPSEQLPKISVVIPSFNQAKYIAATLDSVVAQNYPNIEIYVADGGSTDGSLEIIADFAARHPDVVRYDSRPDGGHHHGVNKGIANTNGDIIAWINSDDVYLPDAFWKVATFFHFNRGAYIVYGRNDYVNEALEPVTEYPVDWSPLLREQKRRMMHFCLVPQPSLFFRRTAVLLCGALDHKILDYELWMRWQQDLPFYFMDEKLSLSRLQKDAISVRAETDLLVGISEVVHRYYGMVPYRWAFSYAYNQAYGAAWARGEAPPVTRSIKFNAVRFWVLRNLAWMPRSIAKAARELHQLVRESWRA